MNHKTNKINLETKIELTDEEKHKLSREKTAKAIAQVVLGSVIYAIGVVWILQIGGFFSGGATGLSQLIVGLFNHFCTNTKLNTIISNNIGTFVLLINIPLLILGWRGLSKKFVILTVIAILLQSLLMNFLSTYTISPVVSLLKDGNGVGDGLIDVFTNGTFRFWKTAESTAMQVEFQNTMSAGTRLLLALIGGAVCGFGAAFCLKAGGSTGGMDIIANYLQVKKQISFTKVQSIVDTTIILSSAIISVENVLFTLVRLFVYMYILDHHYKIYKTDRIEIVTNKSTEIRDALFKRFSHSMTIYNCVGGYMQGNKQTVVIYASNYEVIAYIDIIKKIDPQAFITVSKTRIEKSNYKQKTII